MLKQTSKEFRKLFLLTFTRELIRNSEPEAIFQLQKILKKESQGDKERKELVKDILKEKEKNLFMIKQKNQAHILKEKQNLRNNLETLKKINPVLKIPETKYQTFDYLKSDSRKPEIDLEKLNPLIQDPSVKIIECDGPGENISVRGAMGEKPTKINLNRDEIEHIIRKFSEVANVPVKEGVLKTSVGRLSFSAIVSESVGSKFVIRKAGLFS